MTVVTVPLSIVVVEAFPLPSDFESPCVVPLVPSVPADERWLARVLPLELERLPPPDWLSRPLDLTLDDDLPLVVSVWSVPSSPVENVPLLVDSEFPLVPYELKAENR